MLHVVENHHAIADVGHLAAAILHLSPAQVGVELRVDGIVETGDDARLVQIDDGLLVGEFVAALIGFDTEGDAPHLKAFACSEQRTHNLLVDATEVLVTPKHVQLMLGFRRGCLLGKVELWQIGFLRVVDLCQQQRDGQLDFVFLRHALCTAVDDQPHGGSGHDHDGALESQQE